MTRHNSRSIKLSCRELLHQLFEMWEPQFSESYRQSACEILPEPEIKNNRKISKVGKLKAAETVVETINLMQKSRSQSRGNLTRINSVGSLESDSRSGSVTRKTSVKRTLSQSSNNS